MITLDEFSELLQVLYSAPLQREQWQRFLSLVSRYTASRGGYFFQLTHAAALQSWPKEGKRLGKTQYRPTTTITHREIHSGESCFNALEQKALWKYSLTRNCCRMKVFCAPIFTAIC